MIVIGVIEKREKCPKCGKYIHYFVNEDLRDLRKRMLICGCGIKIKCVKYNAVTQSIKWVIID